MPRTVPGQDSTAKRYLETIADLATPYKLDEAGTLVEAKYPPPYALGWFVQTYRGERLVWHYGYWPGSFSALYLKILQRWTEPALPSLGKGDVTGSAFAALFLNSDLRA